MCILKICINCVNAVCFYFFLWTNFFFNECVFSTFSWIYAVKEGHSEDKEVQPGTSNLYLWSGQWYVKPDYRNNNFKINHSHYQTQPTRSALPVFLPSHIWCTFFPFICHAGNIPEPTVERNPETSGFTGKRLNSKMLVYSGSKTIYLPKMLTLYQQCIRILQNNIDCKCDCANCQTKRTK